ncbi:hypothetical protein L3X38_006114 [Prunus dulcis]|uniref:Uncharacterized protein n=1 Tax=Prunus dulcis TaxID=3755 RepID=A0AAD5F4Q0_PRUDU|nr:hypothetical protein L3X38_006114 [Prunus dulcis]
MSFTIFQPASVPLLHSHAHLSSPLPPMSILRRPQPQPPKTKTTPPPLRQCRRRSTPGHRALDPSPHLSEIEPAAESLFHVRIDLSDAPDLASSHTRRWPVSPASRPGRVQTLVSGHRFAAFVGGDKGRVSSSW